MENPTPEDPILHPEEEFGETQEEVQDRPSYTVMSGIQTVLSIALVMATLLTLWNPRKFLGTPNLSALIRAESAQNILEENSAAESTIDHIGILAGHWQDDPGEVCADGLTEMDVNLNTANRIAQLLTEMGYQVDIFPEFDLALLNYHSAAFVAVYSGSCADSPLPPSGFKVGTSLTAQNPEIVNNLAICVSEAYQEKTRLPFRYEVLNPDHPSYHIFRDIHIETPAILIETGSLKTDRTILTNQAETVAEGIVSGILCFLDLQSGDGQ